MRHINLISAKGGQGVTTTAVLLAKGFMNQGQKVLLVDRKGGDLPAILGYATPEPDELNFVTEGLWLTVSDLDKIEIDGFGFDVVISDGFDPSQTFPDTENFLVTQPCYMALRRFSQSNLDGIIKGVIVVRPANRVLTDRDVANIANVADLSLVITIPMTPEVARASDAGVLSSRLGHSYAVTLDENAISG